MSANDTQVGGDHYRTNGKDLQHWDLAVAFQWDPFQYQITKYVMRWKHKHATHAERLKDLQKAAHFLQKYIEVATEYDPNASNDAPVQIKPEVISADWQVEGYYGDLTQHYRCRHCGTTVRAATMQDAHATHGDCPHGRGYVAQGD